MSHQNWTQTGLYAAIRLTVLADAEPGFLPRLLMAFAKRDLTLDRIEAVREGEAQRVEIAMAAIDADAVHRIVGNIGQIVGVRSVVRRQEITGSVRRRAA